MDEFDRAAWRWRLEDRILSALDRLEESCNLDPTVGEKARHFFSLLESEDLEDEEKIERMVDELSDYLDEALREIGY